MSNIKIPPVIDDFFRDSSGNIISKEVIGIRTCPDQNPVIRLEGILNEHQGLEILEPNDMIEVYDYPKSENEFYVDYNNGYLYVHSSKCKTNFLLKYYTVGGTLISYDKIVTKIDNRGTITELLSEIIDKGYVAIDAMKTLGDAVVIIETLKETVETANTLNIDLASKITQGTTLKNELITATASANDIYPKLKPIVDEGRVLDSSLKNENADARILIPKLESENAKGQEVIEQIRESGVKSFQIESSQWKLNNATGLYECELVHNLGTTKYITEVRELVDDKWVTATIGIETNGIDKVNLSSDNNRANQIIFQTTAYTGTVSDASLINVDKMTDGTNKVLMTIQERQSLANGTEKIKDIEISLNESVVEINDLQDSKVDKIEGKTLSTNDYTNDEKMLVGQVINKRDKTTAITMSDLAQDVKTAMTGGSVAVVGKDAVNTTNVVNGAITYDKMALDSVGNSTLKPTADVQLRVGVTIGGGGLFATYNSDKSITVTLKSVDIEMLKKTGVRHASIFFSATNGGEVFNIPNNARLVWRYTNADGSYGHTKEVLLKDQVCINPDNVVLLQNCEGKLYGKIADLFPTQINGSDILNDSIATNKISGTTTGTVRSNKPIKCDYISGGSVKLTFSPSTTINVYRGNGSFMTGYTFSSETEFIVPVFAGLYLCVDGSKGKRVEVCPNGSSLDTTISCCLINNSSNGWLSGHLSHACYNAVWGDVIRDTSIPISKLEQKAITKLDGVPSYWREYIDTKVTEILDKQDSKNDNFSFAFITDTHIDLNEFPNGQAGGTRVQPTYTGEILKELDKHINFSGVLFGGDTISGQITLDGCKSVVRETMSKYLSYFRDKTICTVGNHDVQYDYRTPKYAPKEILYSLFFKPFMKNMTVGDLPFNNNDGSGVLYGYKDDTVNKIRYISLCCYDNKDGVNHFPYDVAFLGEQLRWLSEKALKVNDEGWKFVLMCHQPMVSEVAFGAYLPHNSDCLKKIMEDFQMKKRCTISTVGGGGIRPVNIDVDFTSYKGKIICFLNGHTHEDFSDTVNGINYIQTECDVVDIPNTIGTTNEHSITVFTVCPSENKLKATRVGKLGASFTTEFTY